MFRRHSRWDKLLDWLKSHGMFIDDLPIQARERQGAGFGLYATCSVPPSIPLFKVPASALLNVITLSSYYPNADPPLSAVQLISLHLALHRPKDPETNDSPDPHFGPYIAVLPSNFASHPLSWVYKRRRGIASVNEGLLLDLLPTSILDDLNKLNDRFQTDWERVSSYLSRSEYSYNQWHGFCPDVVSFLWGWLNVNTRCIYHRIRDSRSDPDNISLCPILDLANHIASGPHMLPKYGNVDLQGRRGDISLISPASSVEKNQELYLIYGAHCNKRLFVEYGFVNQVSIQTLVKGEILGEMDVQKHVEELFRERGKTGEWMKKTLMDEGYWGDWTMHSGLEPAHPSFRLIVALRLYHVIPADLGREAPYPFVQPWKDTLVGTREYVSESNEESWRKTLVEICDRAVAEAQRGISRAQKLSIICESEGWELNAKEMIEQLWLEELFVASEVKKSVAKGVAF